jgi:hypothetical protein
MPHIVYHNAAFEGKRPCYEVLCLGGILGRYLPRATIAVALFFPSPGNSHLEKIYLQYALIQRRQELDIVAGLGHVL